MDTNKILSSSLLDIVFDNRNKDYGAYELRATYTKRIKKALIVTGSLFTLIIAGVAFASSQKKSAPPRDIMKEYTLEAIKEDLPIPPPEEIPPAEQPQVKTEAYVVPVLADVVDEPPPTQAQVEVAAIGTQKIDGVISEVPTEVEIPGDKTGIVDIPKPKEPEIWTSVEIPAKFDGDWKRFLEKNLNPQAAVDNGAPAGRYTVRIKFVVDKEGNVSDIVPLTNHGFGMEEEAVRVLKKAKKWEPAIQNGFKVKAYHTQLITYEVVGDE